MITTQVVETSVTVNNDSPIQDYVRPDDQTQPTFTIVLLQSVTAYFITKCDNLLQIALGMTKSDDYYKVRQNTAWMDY